MTVLEEARSKLEGIIARYGDADGERYKPYYLQFLADEIIAIRAVEQESLTAAHESSGIVEN